MGLKYFIIAAELFILVTAVNVPPYEKQPKESTGLIYMGNVEGKFLFTDMTNEGMSFAEYLDYCHSNRMHAATIDSAVQTEFVVNFYRSIVVNSTYNGRPFWNGITDLHEEGTFLSLRTGQPLNYTNWNEGNPSPVEGNGYNYNCAYLEITGGWVNLPCTTSWRPICELN